MPSSSREKRSVAWALIWFLFVLLSYSIVRPIRETMGAIGGTRQLQGLMLGTFAVMLVAVPAYGALVARLPRRWVVRVVFHFFCVSLVAFSFAMRSTHHDVQVWSARIFFVWVNVFGLFATSVFWSVLADLFSRDQGKRLFGSIAAGGTAGAIMGSLLTSQVATQLSTANLLLLPVVTLQAGLWCAWRLEKQCHRMDSESELAAVPESVTPENTIEQSPESPSPVGDDDAPTGGGLLAGITRVLASPYLAMICLFLFFVQTFGTQMYFQQAEIVGAAIPDESEKTQWFAYLDFGTQTLTLLIQALVAGPVLRRLGVSAALVVLPVVYLVGFTALAMSQTLSTLMVTMIAVRAAGYGITVPAREVLFTVVAREDKYKSKSFIDTVVLRGGDAISSQVIGVLRNTLGYGMATLNYAALPLVLLWAAVAWQLGNWCRRREG